MATAKDTAPVMTEITVSYSAGVKCNLGHNTYENANFSITRSERYDVTGLEDEAIGEFWVQRYDALKADLDARIVEIHGETSAIIDD